MLTNELKCIEVLMRHLIKETSLSDETFSAFQESSTFDAARINLFNLITINYLISSFNEKPAFSLEDFLYTGVIPNLYDERTQTPIVDPQYKGNHLAFYRHLIEALKEGNYVFDENNNIYVSSERIETTIPQMWLYRLSNAFKKNTYQDIFLYNKKHENNILDRNSLIDYIRHTKTFFVTLTPSSEDYSIEKIYEEVVEDTLEEFRNSKEVKVDEIIATFQAYVPGDIKVEISKYKLSDAFWLVSKAEKYEPDFYTLPLEEQQKLIKTWLLEFINSNDLANKQTQKFVLLSSVSRSYQEQKDSISKSDVIIGLFNLYISLISELDIGFDAISMSEFKLSNYLTPELQENLLKLNRLIKLINREHSYKLDYKAEATRCLEQLNHLDPTDDRDEYELVKAQYEKAEKKYQEKDQVEDNYGITRNQLQAEITEEQKVSIADIAFDNERILSLILEATKSGRLYINAKGKTLYIESYNDALGKNTFKTSISLEELLNFISSVNLSLSDYGYIKRAN